MLIRKPSDIPSSEITSPEEHTRNSSTVAGFCERHRRRRGAGAVATWRGPALPKYSRLASALWPTASSRL